MRSPGAEFGDRVFPAAIDYPTHLRRRRYPRSGKSYQKEEGSTGRKRRRGRPGKRKSLCNRIGCRRIADGSIVCLPEYPGKSKRADREVKRGEIPDRKPGTGRLLPAGRGFLRRYGLCAIQDRDLEGRKHRIIIFG